MVGAVTRDSRGGWQIVCDPHVRVRLKRVFARVNKSQHDTVTLTDTLENARELRWFLQRYPMLLDDATTAYLETRAEEHVEREATIARVVADTYEPQPFSLAIPPRKYQEVAADLLLKSGALLLADDVGTGKTVSAICALTDPRTRPALVVTLTHLPQQWKDELAKFAPNLRVHIVKQGSPYKLPDWDVLLINYHKLRGWADLLAPQIKAVIFDEMQELRISGSQKWCAARHLTEHANYAMGLSVGPESIVELVGGPFGAGWVGRIADAFDLAQRTIGYRVEREYSIVGLEPWCVTARGWTGDGFGWKRVKTLIRHACTKPVRTLQVSGSPLLLTDDHSIYLGLPHGRVVSVPSEQVRVDDVIPLDDGAGWDAGTLEQPVDVLQLVAGITKAQVAVNLGSIRRQDIGATAWQWQNFRTSGRHGSRLPLATYLQHRDKLPAPSAVYCGRSRQSFRLAPTILLSRWAYMLGFWLGDGWTTKHRINFAVEAKRERAFVQYLEDLPDIDLLPTVRKMPGKSVEVRCNHVLLCHVLRTVIGSPKCHEKRIPGAWITSWSREARLALLQGLLDSDGSVSKRHGRRYFTTTSAALAEGLMSLLRSLGVRGSTSTRGPSAGGMVAGRQIRGKRVGYTVNWSAEAARGRNDAHRGARRRLPASEGHFLEGVVRSVDTAVQAPSYVYDIAMEGHPSFTASGVLVHNTATPIYNYGGEIFTVLDTLRPNILGGMDEFGREWCNQDRGIGDKTSIDDPRAFGRYLRSQGIMLRRTRADVGRELPALSRIPHAIDCDIDALDAVETTARDLAEIILAADEAERGDKLHASQELSMLLRQATGIAKAKYVAAFVRILLEAGESVVLYGWHHAVYGIWREKLKDFTPAFYTGTESPKQKNEAKRRFVEGGTDLLIVSLRAGAGVDGLQHRCRTVVFGELDWSPGVHEQCIGRVYRDGQQEKVAAYFLLAEAGSDPVVADILGLKRQQSEGVRDPDADIVEQLQVDPHHIRRLAEAYLASQTQRGAAA